MSAIVRRKGRLISKRALKTCWTVVALALASAACRGAAARDAETLPGRTRPLYEHNWSLPRDLQFPENRFTPPDPKGALVTTSSGLRAYVVAAANEQIVQITAAIPLGRSLEQANEIGAAEALSRLLSQQVNERLGAGFMGRVQVDQDVDLTRFSLQVLAEDWQPALSALVQTLRQPRLDAARPDGAQSATAGGGRRGGRGGGGRGGGGQAGPAARPVAELTRMLATYPLAPPHPGVAVKREAIHAIASRSLRPSAVVMGTGGGVSSREHVQRELESVTAGWQALAGAASDITPASGTPRATADRSRIIDEPGYTTWIAVGHPVPKIAPADEAAVAVMTDVLNIRLTIAVREIRGLANSTQLQMPATIRHDGLMHVRSGARPESVAPIIRYAKAELSRIREAAGAPTPEELEQVKGGLVLGKWQGLLDSAGDATATYAAETARFGSLDHLMKWPDAVRSVTAQHVTAVAQKYIHPEQLGTVVIGQLDAVRKARHPRWPATLEEVMPAAVTRRSNP